MKLIGPFKQLLPMTGLPLFGPLSNEQLLVLKDVGILIDGENIAAIGNFEELEKLHVTAEIHFLKGNHTCLPGFIDSNTQLCFGGSGINKNIQETVLETSNTSKEVLAKKTAKLANRHLKNGTTTIEVKSGFGLSAAEELKILRALQDAQLQTKVDLIATYNAAQNIPKEYSGNAEKYLATTSSELFPILKNENLSHRISATLSNSGFSKEQVRSYFNKAVEMGFYLSITENEISKSSDNTTILDSDNCFTTALAGTSIGLGNTFAPARNILDNGGSLAIASNHNPINAPMGDLLTQASILGAYENLSTAEILAGITNRAAAALNLKNCGELAVGKLADFILFHTSDYNEILYNQGSFKPCVVYKKGEVVFDKHK
ncbi:amidohydrolase family protein [Aurantibacter sp.]|uniref:amidohydrolase family protein n=1 Tax=Aurantibacter sp. TaxID=2807103 RepID=UPI003265F6B8